MSSMFETLMELPLFKGAGIDSLSKIVGSCKFHFLKYTPGETIYDAGTECQYITFIISGAIRITIDSLDGRLTVAQTINAYDVISPEFLFGRTTTYPGKVVAIDTVSILQIPKADYLNILNTDKIFLFNYLNQLSMSAQKSLDGVLAVSSGDIRQRIAYWVSILTQPRSTDIEIECRQRDLAGLFGVQRTSIREALEAMKVEGLLDYNPTHIMVKDRRSLLNLLQNPHE